MIIYGTKLLVKEGQKVAAGTLLAEWDPYTTPILTEVSGVVKFGDIVEGVTMQEQVDEVTGLARKVVKESKDPELRPRVTVKDDQGKTKKIPGSEREARYLLPVGANIIVPEGHAAEAGEVVEPRGEQQEDGDPGHRTAPAQQARSRPAVPAFSERRQEHVALKEKASQPDHGREEVKPEAQEPQFRGPPSRSAAETRETSEKSEKRKSGSKAASSSTPCWPVATATASAPNAWAQAMSRGVSPIISTCFGGMGCPTRASAR